MMVFLVALLVILVYAWVAYPVLVILFGEATKTKRAPQGQEPQDPPSVAILFSAHNEEAVIQQRLENLAALEYPWDRVRVFVGVDGGTDRTAEIVTAWAVTHPGVSVVVNEVNRGKMAMLKRLVAGTEEKRQTGNLRPESWDLRPGQEDQQPGIRYLVFTDANTMFAPDAISKLVAPFEDPSVGGVCGRLVFCGQGTGGGTDEKAYWSLETRLKMAESRLDSCLGANGAIYAVRVECFPSDIPDNTIVDDLVIGMKVREQGRRMIYESAAVATEDVPETVGDEWRRRVRIGRGDFQALWICRRCLSPRFGAFAWMFWSHKVFRWFTPHLMLAAVVVAGLCLGDVSPCGAQALLPWMTVGGTAGLLLAAWLGRWNRRLRPIRYFVAMQAALFVGFLRFCGGDLSATWTRTERGVRHQSEGRR